HNGANTNTGSRTGSSYSNTSISSSSSMNGVNTRSGSDDPSLASATGSHSSYGSSLYYHDNENLVAYPMNDQQLHFYDRENLRPAPPDTVPTTPQRRSINANYQSYNQNDLLVPNAPPLVATYANNNASVAQAAPQPPMVNNPQRDRHAPVAQARPAHPIPDYRQPNGNALMAQSPVQRHPQQQGYAPMGQASSSMARHQEGQGYSGRRMERQWETDAR
ncbi:hypothetical protein PMAYCL1PPCAC_28739, partial [Pristionchus mayeri]